ncbi:MAG: corrinoid protein [Clostridia bacterium]|nr:corrinoid protein [Clostridia bacterium]
MSVLNEISAAVQAGKAKDVKALVQQAIDEGIDAKTILEEGMLAGMDVVGKKFKNNEVFVPEVLIAARAMKAGSNVLKTVLVGEDVEPVGKVVVGTVAGDMHDIGKNLVCMMLEGKGLEVIDLGVDVPSQEFIDTALDEGCSVICLSALLTTTMGVMGDIVELCKQQGVRDKFKIMIGGAPVTQEFCDKIGADAYTPDAASCAEVALGFCQE